jgi:chemotaxis signal transduction protein
VNVVRITRAVAVQRVPGAAAPILGAVTIRGRPLPVVSLQQWLGLPAQEIRENAQFVIAEGDGQTAVLIVDGVTGRLDYAAPPDPAGAPFATSRPGVTQCADGLILVTDLAPLLARIASAQAGADPAPKRYGG